MNRSHIYSLVPYLLVGVALWYCVFMSGVHSTIAGVLLAFAIPTGSRVNLKSFISWSGGKVREARDAFDDATPVMGQQDYLKTVQSLSNVARQVVPPATRLEHKLYPWVYFGILPLFALTNADVSFVGGDLGAMFSNPVLYGVFFGLLVGKPVGIMLFSFIVVKLKVASLPQNVNWIHMLGAAILGGVGFTMAIFVANLAFADEQLVTAAKLGHPVRLASGRRARVRLFVPAGTRREKAWRGVPDHRFRRRMLADRRRGGGAPGGEAVGRDRKPASERGDHRREARERRGGSGGRSGGGRDAQRRIGRRGRRRRGHVGHGRERNGREVPWKQQPSCWRRVQEPA